MAFNSLIDQSIQKARRENNPEVLEQFYKLKVFIELLGLEGWQDISVEEATKLLYPTELSADFVEKIRSAKSIGKKIKLAREFRNVNQRELSKLTDISAPFLSLLEDGQRDQLSFDRLFRISKSLNVPIELFYDEV